MRTTGGRRRDADHAGQGTNRLSKAQQQVLLGVLIVALFALMIYNARYGL